MLLNMAQCYCSSQIVYYKKVLPMTLIFSASCFKLLGDNSRLGVMSLGFADSVYHRRKSWTDIVDGYALF